MTQPAATYRWNTSAAAEAYDQAAPAIHPFYTVVQDQILAQLPPGESDEFLLVDLGGGSGRLVERVLDQFPRATAVLVDQSEPFLAIAERRLSRFGARSSLVQSKLQDDWASRLPRAPQAIVSMSAIHHLEPAEKRALYTRIFDVLAPGGLFINGDESRPESDAEFRTLLERWAAHMQTAIDVGRIPPEFQTLYGQWYDRNIIRFSSPKKSGEDCLETLDLQRAFLSSIGFGDVSAPWQRQLWAILRASKPS